MPIYFYKVQDPYGCFSNFSRHPIVMAGVTWSTSEHYYQAQKFLGTVDESICERIHQASTPEEAAALGRDRSRIVRADWEQVKCAVMYDAVSTKFRTHLDIQRILLETGTETIIENSPTDCFWGCGVDRDGENHLGRILMRVRSECQN